jgi:hypothetical protein
VSACAGTRRPRRSNGDVVYFWADGCVKTEAYVQQDINRQPWRNRRSHRARLSRAWHPGSCGL